MNLNRIYGLFKTYVPNYWFSPKNNWPSVLANYSNITVGVCIKIFTLNSDYYNNTVGVILTAQYSMIFYLEVALATI